MCVPADARPPIEPVRGASIDHQPVTLQASDGTIFGAFEAIPQGRPESAGVIVLPDVRGLFGFYEELALRFAEIGYRALTIDYFGRSAALPPRGSDFEFMPHVRATTLDGLTADVGAAVSHLRTGAPDRKLAIVGFCFGGSNSWYQAAAGHGLSAAIGFYGNPDRTDVPQGAPTVISLADQIECPVLALMAGDDPGIPLDTVDRFRAALDESGVENSVVVYPNAPHSFFDRSFDVHAEESADAWDRVVAFLAANL